jgi:hypothetical protein
MQDFYKKPIFLHLVLVVLGLLLSIFLFFKPTVIDGKSLNAHDNEQSQAMTKEIDDFEAKTGEKSLWTNSLFGGMPTYMIKGDARSNVFMYITMAVHTIFPDNNTAGIIFNYFLFLYILFVVLKIKPFEAFLGAIMFSLATYNVVIISAGHITKAYAIGYIPLILAGIILTYRSKYLTGALVTCLGVGMQVYINHFQITFYTAIVVALLVLAYMVYAIMQKEIANWVKATSVVAIASVLAALPNVSHVFTTYEYQKETMRGGSELSAEAAKTGKKTTGLEKDYAFAWSEGRQESFSLLIPRFYGGGSVEDIGKNNKFYERMKDDFDKGAADDFVERFPAYHGDQGGTAGTIYIGAIVVFLAVLGFFLIEGAMKWWLMLSIALSLMMSWGSNLPGLNYFLFDNVPLFNKFRSVSMWLSITGLLAVISAVFGLHEFLNNQDEEKKKKHLKYLYISAGIVGGICLFFWATGIGEYDAPGDAALAENLTKAHYPEWVMEAVKEQREDMLQSDALRSFAFIALAFGALFFYTKKTIKSEYVVLALTVLCIIDILPFDKAFFPKEKFQKVKKDSSKIEIEATAADKEILKDTSPNYRVLNLTGDVFNEANTSYFHKSVGGYHPAKLRRYQDLIENYINQEAQVEAQKAMRMDSSAFVSANVLNMLNTKYVIVSPEANGVITNKHALGNVWLIDSLQLTKTAKEEIDALGKINPKTTALIASTSFDEGALKKKVFSSQGAVVLTSYEPNKIEYTADVKDESFAVFSEIYYPYGWKASIDDKEVEHLRVDYTLRGLVIPAGKHKITFVFDPDSFTLGKRMSSISSVIILLLFGAVIFMEWKKRKKTVQA